ncbi:MAG: hypothetical protein ACK5X3_14980 [Pseudomonadota bacterium]|jgi:hypothetical protein
MKLTKDYLSQWLEAIRDGYAVTVVEPEEGIYDKWMICVENPKYLDDQSQGDPVFLIEVPE